MCKLVVAEKPSVAQTIAKVIGATGKKDGYLEGNGYVVSWCIGHLVELATPEQYDARYEKWKYEDLPIFPKEWQYRVSAGTKKQFKALQELMKRADVDSLVCATDAGREGELIFRLVYHQTGCKKPFERLWISSMEDEVIKEGFANLKPGTEYDALYEAALCRERADWIVGMNATRLFSTLYGQTLNVGRVMTPTLAMLVMREAEISGFKPEPFYSVSISVAGITATGERLKDRKEAEKVLADVSLGKKIAEAPVTMASDESSQRRQDVSTKDNISQAEQNVKYNSSANYMEQKALVSKLAVTEKKEKAPALYDLTSLQRDANRMLGFTAQQTLDYTQSLYEKKLCTYPRTDSRFLTEDMEGMLPGLVENMKEKFGFRGHIVVNPKQVINNQKVSDHHAIIPTMQVGDAVFAELSSGEQKVLSLITARLLAAVGGPAVNKETSIEFLCAGHTFTAKSKQTVKLGWREIWEWILGKKTMDEDKVEEGNTGKYVDVISEGKSFPVQNPELKEGKTTPKKHFTDVIHFESRQWKYSKCKGAG